MIHIQPWETFFGGKVSRRKVDSFLVKSEVSRRNAMLPEEQLPLAA